MSADHHFDPGDIVMLKIRTGPRMVHAGRMTMTLTPQEQATRDTDYDPEDAIIFPYRCAHCGESTSVYRNLTGAGES